jgi:hypothetical protein
MAHRLVVAGGDVVNAVAHLGPQTALHRAYLLAIPGRVTMSAR